MARVWSFSGQCRLRMSAFLQQRVVSVAAADAEAVECLILGVGVMGDQFQTEPFGDPGRRLGNRAHSHEAQRRAGQFLSLVAGFFPTAFAETRVEGENSLHDGQQQGDCVFGDRDGIRAGRGQDRDTAFGGCCKVDVVDPDSVLGNDAQLGGRVDDAFVQSAHPRYDGDRAARAEMFRNDLGIGISRGVDRPVAVIDHQLFRFRVQVGAGHKDCLAHRARFHASRVAGSLGWFGFFLVAAPASQL